MSELRTFRSCRGFKLGRERQVLAVRRHSDSGEVPSNNGDAADRPNRHLVCFRKPRASLPGR